MDDRFKRKHCPKCHYPEPADWCWDCRDIDCPLGFPPRWVIDGTPGTMGLLWRIMRDMNERLAKLENPPCCAGGPQWGHAWNCPECPD
jgi:hypothetical protein